MGFNTNATFDLKSIERLWPKFLGMLVVWGLVMAMSVWLYNFLKINSLKWLCVWAAFTFMAIFLFWTIQTKRWFQRTGYSVLLVFFGIVCLGCITFYYVYPNLIKDKYLDIVYIRYWLTAFIVIVLSIIAYFSLFKKHEGLSIVFMVSNQSQYEQEIKEALCEARNKVEQLDDHIQIIIPPFGIANSHKECERYINSHFNQADAIIFASLINSPQNSEFGYSFNRFTSIMSDRYVEKESHYAEKVKSLMDESYRCHEWNTLNIKTDQISRQIVVAENLSHLFLMYVSCIYLQKHKYSDAAEVADKLYIYTLTGNPRYDNLVKDLLAHSYMMAQYNEEYDNQDYHLANEILDECVSKLPQLKTSLAYELSKARIYFYKGDIKGSKQMTKLAKAGHANSEWYVAANLAFYAIYEKKPKEIVSHYKKMLKMPERDPNEVEYAIRFMKIECDKTKDRVYLMGLYHGIAFLYNYIDEKLSEKYLKKTKDYARVNGYQELEAMRELIIKSRGKLLPKNK